ncbi:MAG: O-antigen ligase family protein [Dokdonella sp.]
MFPLVLLYLVLVLIRPQEYPGLIDLDIPFMPAAMLGAVFMWLVANRKKPFDAPQYVLLVAFLVILMLSKVVNGWAGGAIEQLKTFGPSVVAFVLVAHATIVRTRTTAVMAVFALCSAVLAVHGIEQVQSGTGWTGMPLVQDGRIQYVGIFSDPNDLGMLFVMVLPMAVYLSSRGGLLGMRRLFWLTGAALLLFGIYLTNSRGALLAVAVVAAGYIWLHHGKIWAGIIGSVCLASMMMLPSRLQDLDVDEDSAAGRIDAWYSGFQMFTSHPVLGVGAGNFTDNNYLTAHNSFVLVIAETGYVGFTIWLAFVGYCFWMMVTVLRHRPDLPDPIRVAAWAEEQAIARTLLLSLCGFFATAFFLSRSYVILLYLLAGLVVGFYTGARERFPSLRGFSLVSDAVRWLLFSAAGILALFIVVKLLLAAG